MSAQASNARRGQNHVIGQPSADNKAVVGGGAVWQGVAHAGGGLAVIIGRHGNKRGVRLTHLVPSRRRLQQHIPCFHPSAEPADGRADGGSGDEVVRGAARGCRRCLRPTCRRFPTERQPKSGGSRVRAAFAICDGAQQAGSTPGVCDSADALLHFRIPTGLLRACVMRDLHAFSAAIAPQIWAPMAWRQGILPILPAAVLFCGRQPFSALDQHDCEQACSRRGGGQARP